MVDPIAPNGSTIVTTPAPAAPVTPEAKFFPTGTPVETPPVVQDPVVPPVTPPTEPKPPTEPATTPGTPPATPAPTDIDLKLPEGSPLSAEDLAAIKKEAIDGKMTKEQAEGMLNARNTGALALKTAQDTAFAKVQTQWKETVEKDPEMGGEHLPETVLLSSRAFKALASPELQIWAEKTGLGNYPEFVRMMAKVGKLMGEDRLIRGSVNESPAKKPPEEILFGKTTPNK